MSDTVENLKTARALIDKVGLNRGGLYQEGIGYCAMGAVVSAKFEMSGQDVLELNDAIGTADGVEDHRNPYSSDNSDGWPEFQALRQTLPDGHRIHRSAWQDIFTYNDAYDWSIFPYTHLADKADILAWFDRAIEVAESE